ncbi:hypothetical protein MCEMSE15_02928 [Fimbriimonadaceae bacterium]
MRFRLLGVPSASQEGEVVPLPVLRKSVALLAYLAVHGTTSRTVLAERLWPEGSEEAARQSLRTALTALKRALGPTVVVADRVSLSLREPFQSDIKELRAAVSLGQDSVAFSLYAGPFLDGFYEPWAIELGAEIESIVAGAVLRWDTTNPSEESFRALSQFDAVSSGHVAVAKRLIFNHLQTGDIRAARATIHRLEAATGEINREARALLRDSTALKFKGTYGRSQELAELVRLVAVHRWVTIVAPGGLGKTHLAQEFVRSELNADFFVVRDLSCGEELPAVFGAADWEGLRNRSLPDLVVLDEGEEVPELGPAITRLLHLCPNVNVVVTSRLEFSEPLETVFPLGPIQLPDLESPPEQSPAVQMFLAVVRRPVDIDLVAQICRLVQGQPLAISILARAARTESLETILNEIGEFLEPLHRALTWSIARLDTAGLMALQICAALPQPLSLSTIRRSSGDVEAARKFGLATISFHGSIPVLEPHTLTLNIIRKGLSEGKRAEIYEQVLKTYAETAEEFSRRPRAGASGATLESLALENGALEFLLLEMYPVDPELCREVFVRLSKAWPDIAPERTVELLYQTLKQGNAGDLERIGGDAAGRRMDYAEAATRFRRAVEASSGQFRGRALLDLAHAHAELSNFASAEECYVEGHDLLAGTDDEGWALTIGARIAWIAERDDLARARGIAAISKLREIDAPLLLGRALHELATVCYYSEDYEASLQLMRESAAVKRRLKNGIALASSLEGESMALMGLSRVEEAHGPLLDAMRRMNRMGDVRGFEQTLFRAAEWCALNADLANASRFFAIFQMRSQAIGAMHHHRKKLRIEALESTLAERKALPIETDRELIDLFASLGPRGDVAST